LSDPLHALEASLADRYRFEHEVGRGGMATVYLVHDVRHGRPLALKVIRRDIAALVGPERFLQEISVTARLQHPHILPILDSGEALGTLWYAMPYVEGGSLRTRLKAEPQLGIAEATGIGREIADALGYAHAHGIVHRDVKPENILLTDGPDGHALLADFGIARVLGSIGPERLTESGLVLGTPCYMSPEQASGQDVDGRSDVYALGCVVYEMLAGSPPFTGPTAQAVAARHAMDRVPPLRTVRPAVSPVLEAVLLRALEKVAADRYRRAEELAAGLGASVNQAAGAGTVAAEPAVTTAVPAIAPRGSGRRWVRAGAIGVAIAALSLGLIVGMTRLRQPVVRLDGNLLAVAPFDVLDPSLQLWHEGLVDVLSRDLDGAGPIRTVPQSVGLHRWSGRADRPSAEAFGGRTGAGLVVYGSVVRRGGDSVSLGATVLDLHERRAPEDVEVRGETSRMGDLADSLGVGILRALGRWRPVGSVRQVSLGSRSLPALKAFLRGEQFYRRGMWDSAAAHYSRSIAEDTTNALAYRRMATVLGWNLSTSAAYQDGESYLRRAIALNRGLSPRDSLLLVSDSLALAFNEPDAPFAGLQIARLLEEAVRRYPEDPELWYELGETREHLLGGLKSPGPELEAFERAIDLDPGFAPAYEHTFALSMDLGKPDQARRFTEAYAALDSTADNAEPARLAALLLHRQPGDSTVVAHAVQAAPAGALFRAGLEFLSGWPDSAETAVGLLRRLAETNPPPGTGSAPWVMDTLMRKQYLAAVLAVRGHLREAFQADRKLIKDPAASPFSPFADPFVELSLLGMIPDSIARATFERSLVPGTSWGSDPQFPAPRAIRGAPWWFVRRDTAALTRFAARAARVEQTAGSLTEAIHAQYRRLAAEAYLTLLHGDSARAEHLLRAIPDSLCAVNTCFYEKVTLARLLAARGELRGARELLDRWRWGGRGALFVLATQERGRLAERLGDRIAAIADYQYVAAIWRQADPELQRYVSEAREGIGRLTAER
jgi:eukaryotic-like serine/threonine-protein kinase